MLCVFKLQKPNFFNQIKSQKNQKVHFLMECLEYQDVSLSLPFFLNYNVSRHFYLPSISILKK